MKNGLELHRDGTVRNCLQASTLVQLPTWRSGVQETRIDASNEQGHCLKMAGGVLRRHGAACTPWLRLLACTTTLHLTRIPSALDL